jgi:hypothetical protein
MKMRTDEDYAVLRAARINEENTWDAVRASDWNNPCNKVWDNYSNAAKILEELEASWLQRT